MILPVFCAQSCPCPVLAITTQRSQLLPLMTQVTMGGSTYAPYTRHQMGPSVVSPGA